MLLDTARFGELRHDIESNLLSQAAKFSFGEPSSAKAAESLLAYTYAVLHSPTYRVMFVDFLAREFPRVPVSSDHALARELAGLGVELTRLHLMESPRAGPVHHHLLRPREPRSLPCRLVGRHRLAGR